MSIVRQGGLLASPVFTYSVGTTTNPAVTPGIIYICPADCLRVDLQVSIPYVTGNTSVTHYIERVKPDGSLSTIPVVQSSNNSVTVLESLTPFLTAGNTNYAQTLLVPLFPGEYIRLRVSNAVSIIGNNAVYRVDVHGIVYDRSGVEDDTTVPFWECISQRSVGTNVPIDWLSIMGAGYDYLEVVLPYVLNNTYSGIWGYKRTDGAGNFSTNISAGGSSNTTMAVFNRSVPTDTLTLVPVSSNSSWSLCVGFMSGIRGKFT